MKVKNIKVEQLEVNTGQLEGLPTNPRIIKDHRFEALKKSISDAPEMLGLRELLVYPLDNGNYIVIGGNMRLEACRALGYTELPCKVIDKEVPIAKLREYTIKDNIAFGETDWDLLANEWDQAELSDWGMTGFDFGQGLIDFDRVEEINEDNYEQPKTKILECPVCHNRDYAIHFKSVDSISDGAVSALDDGDDENNDAE